MSSFQSIWYLLGYTCRQKQTHCHFGVRQSKSRNNLPFLGHHQPKLLILPFCRPQGDQVLSAFLSFLGEPSVGVKACSDGTLISRCPGEKVTWAFSLQRQSWPRRGIGRSGMYKKLHFNIRFPNWHSNGLKMIALYFPWYPSDWGRLGCSQLSV